MEIMRFMKKINDINGTYLTENKTLNIPEMHF